MGATMAAPAETTAGDLAGPGSARQAVAEMAWLLRDARAGIVLGTSLLTAITLGIGLEAAFSPTVLRAGLAGFASAAVLAVLLGCWLRAAALLLLAGRPVLEQLNAHRWRSGAPVDPRVRWLTLPPSDPGAGAWDWTSVNLLLGAVRIRCERVHLADTWTFVTAAVFGVWTALIFLS
jgi:hypothetical protein